MVWLIWVLVLTNPVLINNYLMLLILNIIALFLNALKAMQCIILSRDRIMVANGLENRDSVPDRVIPKLQKMVFWSLLTQHYKLRIKGKWSSPGKGVATSPVLWCSSFWKGSLRVTLLTMISHMRSNLIWLAFLFNTIFHSIQYFVTIKFGLVWFGLVCCGL